MPVTIEIQIIGAPELEAQLAVAPELLAVANRDAMAQALPVAEYEIKAITPRRTGRLFSAWEARQESVGGQVVGHLGNDVSYAAFVEGGTRPHDIVAHGNALMIPVAKGGGFGGGKLTGRPRAGQQVAFFRRVHHPGTSAVHMAAKGLDNAKADILGIFTAAVNRVLATIKGAP